MNRSIDVRTEVRRLTGTKPVQAVAGMGVLASQALRGLPARLAQWREDASAAALPARAGDLSVRAGEYMKTAREVAVRQYDSLASRGRKALNGRAVAHTKGSANGKAR